MNLTKISEFLELPSINNNMKIKIIRQDTNNDGTFGILVMEGFHCCTAELPWRDNALGKSCIPAGKYTANLYNSPKFGSSYKLEDTDPRSYILIHKGNYAGDEDRGLRADVDGCILLGATKGVLNNQKVVLSSANTVNTFMKKLDGKEIEIEIIELYD